jgi:DNA polymerase I-like protein with 3'-5' exonuclease and polymerase domains
MNFLTGQEGPSTCSMYILIEQPSAIGIMFSDYSRNKMKRMLMERGILLEQCRLWCVSNIYVRDFRAAYYLDKKCTKPQGTLLDRYTDVWADVVKSGANVVLCLGEEALRCMSNERGIKKWRGSIIWNDRVNCKVVATYSPGELIKAPSNAPLAMFDVKRAITESKDRKYDIPPRLIHTLPSFEKSRDWLRLMSQAPRISTDVETDEDLHITALAISSNSYETVSIPFTNEKGDPYYTFEEEVELWKLVKLVLENPKSQKIFQNGQFDITAFKVNPFHINTAGTIIDTMLMLHTVYPEIAASEDEEGEHRIAAGKGLGLITSLCTRQPYYKHWGKDGSLAGFCKYNGMDTLITFEAADVLEKNMKEFGVHKFYFDYVEPLIQHLINAQMKGVKINHAIREEAKKKYQEESVTLQNKLNEALGYNVNILSSKQLAELLYEDLGFPIQVKRGTKAVTTDNKAMEKLRNKKPSALLDLISIVKKNEKLVGTYLEDDSGKDGRMRCSYVIGGTLTGRLSSRASVFGTGTNLQNIPKGICRRMFDADEGMTMVKVDLSQAEARVVAYLSEDPTLIKVFETNGDIHKLNASWIFDKAQEEVTKDEREQAKKGVHALNYGMGPGLFGVLFGCSMSEAKRLSAKYFDTFPCVNAWHLRIQSHLNKNRTMTTALGRKRTFFEPWGDGLFRSAYSYEPQSIVGDLLNKALVRFCNSYPKADLLLQVHDEFDYQVYDKDVDESVIKLKEACNIPLTINGRTFTIPCDIKVGRNWQDMSSYVPPKEVITCGK